MWDNAPSAIPSMEQYGGRINTIKTINQETIPKK